MKLINFLLCTALGLTMTACNQTGRDSLSAPYFTTEVKEGTTVIHVSPKGSDVATGDIAQPLATLSEALRRVEPGRETVIRLAPGGYREHVTLSHKATAEAPLIIEGARNGLGEWLSVIDGASELTASQWQARPELGPGVYAYPDGGVRFLLVDDRSVGRLDQAALVRRLGDQDQRPQSIGEVLAWPEEQIVLYRKREIPFWETIGGVYTPSADGSETLLRLKGGVNPAKHLVSSARAGGVITLDAGQYVTLRNLLIRGGQHGIDLLGAQTQHNRVEHCYIPHGRRRINIDQGAANTVILGNRLENGFIGLQTGAWAIDDSAPDSEAILAATQKGFIYNYFKYWASPKQTSDDISIHVGPGEGETVIEGNLLDGGLIGIGFAGDGRVARNVIRRMSSVGTAVRLGSGKVVYDGNLFSDCNINIRLHHLNNGKARELNLLRNVSLLPEGRGTHIFCHYMRETEATPEHHIAFYQNTFLGGRTGLALPPMERPEQALRNFQVVNNRFIGCTTLLRVRRSILGSREMFGGFDYNQIIAEKLTSHDPAVWLGKHNLIEEAASGWSWNDLTYTSPTPDSGQGRGVDVSKPYEISGREFPALPGLHPNYFSGERPDPGAPEADFSNVLSYDYQ